MIQMKTILKSVGCALNPDEVYDKVFNGKCLGLR